LVESNAGLVRFVRELIRFRLGNPTLRRRSFLVGGASGSGSLPDVEWFGPDGEPIDWGMADGGITCFLAAPTPERLIAGNNLEAGGVAGVPRHVLVMAHAENQPRAFVLPAPAIIRALPWRVFVQTGRAAPNDIFADGRGPLVDASQPLELPGRSLVCLVASPAEAVAAQTAVPRK
jgi:glycogen operon protein